jgi:selenide,water dikinase
LLIACAPERADTILATIIEAGYPFARIIGHAEAGAPSVRVES